ncbi:MULTISPECIES: hypothetical protein [Streptomyces]|uniref:Uncharacterized protein n=1 Tax=Streptomyces noursei TaxID=1971 RepID=A0A059WG54_STRNR|nr:hypothetical protein [Streptomyces noursei]AKA06562.1 hypothetical protein SAZ_32070 [Streptomyces noursei ZPM]AIA06822.1 hypothetical protein DC74_6385 [Streptomyces noursei]EXU87197.1 hypothetical protein P354_37600 [Streptomyces noursei PD-1]MCE4944233.1 hypothetical protein [Streptomyces noursei]UWS75072.1 hypothetical protein N1H47_29825 [Streptomyces noursei]
MRKLHKAAVVAAALGSISILGAGTANAQAAEAMHGGWCHTHDLNLDILGQVGILNGLLGNAINGEGAPGAQISPIGSGIGCGHGGGGI